MAQKESAWQRKRLVERNPEIIAFDELRMDFKNPIDQGNPARAVSLYMSCPRLGLLEASQTPVGRTDGILVAG
ncbi:UNVERIFIED_CONTAM: hypothetical protein K2H54_017613 [Gekko kuhli]